ncbi:S-layer homology domain-containing protein [Paenibacillus sp. HW567]|uniref:S-layer homology domain-containing protein n=1 Tax=Paenibacillus sp. HW567 TaxID=1034769 RepID=UPI0003716332|nr:S-layer homology domain-containing protein [Paenibacillus sp. HW567]
MYKQTLTSLVIIIMLLGSILAPTAHAETRYTDINEEKYAWAMQSINFMDDNDILKGYPDGTFRPEGTVTKAEFTVMVYRLFDKYRPNLKATGYEKILGYPDVPKNYWAYKEISAIYDYTFNWGGAISVNDSGKFIFKPEARITRLSLTNMLYSFFDQELITEMSGDEKFKSLKGLKDIPVKQFTNEKDFEQYRSTDGRYSASTGAATNTNEKVFPILFNVEKDGVRYMNDDVSSVQASAIASMQSQGIITANANGYFRPLAPITRAEMVTILDRIYLLLDKKEVLQKYSTK